MDDSVKLTALINEYLNHPSDVFHAVREVDGKLKRGYWYRIYEDEDRKRWTQFGFLGESTNKAEREIKKLKVK
jgi:hypothetical protein